MSIKGKRARDWYRANKEHACKLRRESDRKRNLKAMSVYGNKCGACDNNNLILLQWHHRNGNVPRERTRAVIRQVIEQGRLDRYELLCSNCHILADIRDDTNIRGKKYE